MAAPSERTRLEGIEEVERVDSQTPEVSRRRRLLWVGVLLVAGLLAAVLATRVLNDPSAPVKASPGDAPRSTTTTSIDPTLAGTTVRLLASSGAEEALGALADSFEAKTGISIELTITGNAELFGRTVDSDEAPDLVLTADVTDLVARCADGRLVALDSSMIDTLRADQHEDLVVSSEDIVCGAALSATATDVVWYNPSAMDAAGYQVPETWEELESVSRQLHDRHASS